MRGRRGNDSIIEKTLDEKIGSCRKLVIQSMEKTIQQRMFYNYLKEKKLEGQVAQFRVNGSDGIIKLTFTTPEQAMNFYEGRSWIDGIITRKFNVYFDLSASQAEVKKYFLRGVNEAKIRKVFQKCREYGVIRMNTLYGHSKMKDTCILSYLRTQPLSNKEFTALANQLQAMLIMLDHFKQKNGNNSQIRMSKSELKMSDFEMDRPQHKMSQHEVDRFQPRLEKILQLPEKKKGEIFTINLITNHGEYQNDITQRDEKITLEMQKIVETNPDDIEINRFKIPTLNNKQNRVLLVRDIQFASSKVAFQKFTLVSQWLKLARDGMAYLYLEGKISTLIVVRPEKYVVKSREGRCTIFSRTEERNKLIKLAELDYEQIEDFICQQEKLIVNFYKSSQIEVFGNHFDNNPDDDSDDDW